MNLSIQQADATGKIAFNNSVWNLSSRFTVMESATGGPDDNFTIGDLVIVKEHFGENTSAPYPKYDPNKDGIVDIMDIVYVATKIRHNQVFNNSMSIT